ncbi:MAG: amidohydrolase family protein [Verrucomicrobia bacterium]|nr:amidohydrolase family protein [Verrucomicrobiota bacterium]
MKKGDIYTHCFHGYPNTILEPKSKKIISCVEKARSEGVLFDVGHGMGSFSWPVAEACARQGIWPDTISTDIHSLNIDGPVYDLPTVMTRLLHIGMPLVEVVRASTIAPAKAIGWDHQIGTLEVGREADITVLHIEDSNLDLEDCHAQLRPLRTRLIPKAVWRAGKPGVITKPDRIPNPDTYQPAIDWREKLVIRDDP